jgi:hypothetical protein
MEMQGRLFHTSAQNTPLQFTTCGDSEENVVRKRIQNIYNNSAEDFETLADYNDYLEDVSAKQHCE